MLCHRGCGLISNYINYKGLGCCSKITQHCPIVKQKIGKKNSIALKGKKLTKEHKNKISNGLTGHIVNKTSREKSSKSNKEYWRLNPRTPWNKGLTKEDIRVASYANKQKGTTRAARIKLIPSDDPIYNNHKKYRNRIAVRTVLIYEEYKDKINPNNLPLGKAGVSGAYQVDHIMSVKEGFTYSVPIELIASVDNLRVIPWQENITKYSKVDYSIVPESIKNYLKEHKCVIYY